uniref:Uncharacterized protein n=1 Tax=Schlesneria paludicola TaxID=360056 RepID=A0A7C2K0R0_9PLAN
MTIDRANRDRLIVSINRYLSEETTAFKFDDELFAIREATTDQTIHLAVELLWTCYDDLNDHKVHLTREVWDYVQRLLLVLESDATIELQTRRHWDAAQLWAAMTLTAVAAVSIAIGLEWQLLLLWPVMWCVSLLIFHTRDVDDKAGEPLIEPFVSISQIAELHRPLTRFRKRRYPPIIAGRRIRRGWAAIAMALWLHSAWLMFSPFALLWQSLPRTEGHLRVSLPEEDSLSLECISP